MSRPDPAAALNGTRTGNICDVCNRGVQTGDRVYVYVTYYEKKGWIPRRLWCVECGRETGESKTENPIEVIAEAIFWNNRLAGTSVADHQQRRGGHELW